MTPPVIAIVVPCYNEEATLPESIPVLDALLKDMAARGIASAESFLLAVDDGSRDNTWTVISMLHAVDSRIKGIRLAHNRGQQAAMLAGLMTVMNQCDAAITVDADLQDAPEAIIRMVEQFNAGSDIVYGVRDDRSSDSWLKRTCASLFYRFQQAMELETIFQHSEFRLMSRRALELLAQYGEATLYLRGIFPHIGLPHSIVTYARQPRLAGSTKYSFGKLVSLSVDAITSFTARPMRWIFILGVLLLVADVFVGIYVGLSLLKGAAISGWASLMLSIWFLGSLILICLGIIGEYIGKIFTEVKHRPRYAIQDSLMD